MPDHPTPSPATSRAEAFAKGYAGTAHSVHAARGVYNAAFDIIRDLETRLAAAEKVRGVAEEDADRLAKSLSEIMGERVKNLRVAVWEVIPNSTEESIELNMRKHNAAVGSRYSKFIKPPTLEEKDG